MWPVGKDVAVGDEHFLELAGAVDHHHQPAAHVEAEDVAVDRAILAEQLQEVSAGHLQQTAHYRQVDGPGGQGGLEIEVGADGDEHGAENGPRGDPRAGAEQREQ